MLNKISKISIITLFFNLAINTLNFVFGLYFLELTGSAFIFGTLTIIGPLVSLILTPIMTKIVDSINHKKILLFSQIVALIFLILYELIPILGKSSELITAYDLMVILRICEELFVVTLKSSVSQIVEKKNYQKLNAIIQSATSTANVLGPIIGGIFYSVLDLHIFIILIAVFLGISIIFTTLISFEYSIAEHDQEYHSFSQILYYVKERQEILSLVIIAMFLNFFASSIMIGLPIIVLKQMHLAKIVYSFLESLTSVAMVSGGLILTFWTIKNDLKAIYKLMFAFAIVIIGFGIPEYLSHFKPLSIVVLSLLVLIFGFIVVYINTTMTTYLQNTVPDNKQGGVYSIINAVSQLFVPIGSLGYGLLFDHFDSLIIYISSGLIALLVIILITAKTKQEFFYRR